MAFTQTHPGQDEIIQFTAKNKAGAVVDLTAYSIFIVYLYYQNGSGTLEKYSSSALAGFNSGDLKAIDLVNGRFDINLQSAVTTTAKLEFILAELKAKASNTDFDNNSFKTIDSGIEVLEFVASVTKGDSLD